jgi:hypothetical protein
MARYASRILKVQFEGPDVYQESLYDLLRVCALLFFDCRLNPMHGSLLAKSQISPTQFQSPQESSVPRQLLSPADGLLLELITAFTVLLLWMNRPLRGLPRVANRLVWRQYTKSRSRPMQFATGYLGILVLSFRCLFSSLVPYLTQ